MNPQSSSTQTSTLSSPESPSVWKLGLFSIVFLGLIFWNSVIVFLTIKGLDGRDFSRFYYSALAYFEDANMYSQSPATFIQWSGLYAEQLWNLNPPIFQLFFLPLAHLSLLAAFGLWAVFSFSAYFFSIKAIRQELSPTLSPSQIRLILLSTLGFAGTGALLHTGQLSFILLLPFTLSWIYARKGLWEKAGLLLGFLSAIKPFFLIFLPFIFFRRQYRGSLLFAGTFIGMFGLGFMIFGWEAHVSWVHALRDVDWTWSWINASIHGFLRRILAETPIFEPTLAAPHLIFPLYVLCSVVVGVMTFVVILKDQSPLSVDRAFLILTIAALLISPVGWIYYFFFLIGPLGAMVQGWHTPSPGTFTSNQLRLFRTRRWILMSTLPGYFFPIYLLPLFQPNPVATFFIGSTYFWCTGFLWVAIFIDGWAQVSPSNTRISISKYFFPGHEPFYPQNTASTIADIKNASS
jgi:hypothetical protein